MVGVLIIFGTMVLSICLAALIGICIEKRNWNGGHCRKCKHKLSFFSYDSQGGRGTDLLSIDVLVFIKA